MDGTVVTLCVIAYFAAGCLGVATRRYIPCGLAMFACAVGPMTILPGGDGAYGPAMVSLLMMLSFPPLYILIGSITAAAGWIKRRKAAPQAEELAL